MDSGGDIVATIIHPTIFRRNIYEMMSSFP